MARVPRGVTVRALPATTPRGASPVARRAGIAGRGPTFGSKVPMPSRSSSSSRLRIIAGLALLGVVASYGAAVIGALRAVPDPNPVERPGAGPKRAVTLPDGSALVVPERPRRVVPASARAVDLVAALLPPARIAGLPRDALEYATLRELEERFDGHPRFASYMAEEVLALAPDLVVADSWQAADTHARLRGAGLPVLVLPEVADWTGVRRDLELLGRVLGERSTAAALIEDGDRRVAALRRGAPGRAGLRVMSYANFGGQGFTAGDGTTLGAMLDLCGAVNAAAAAGIHGHGQVAFEDLLLLDPDVLVVSRRLHAPTAHAGDRGGASERLLRTEEALAGLRAVREDRIVRLDAGLFASASHQIVAGAEELAAALDALAADEPSERLPGAGDDPTSGAGNSMTGAGGR